MTIRTKLLISNVLMVILPLIMVVLTLVGVYFVYVGVTGNQPDRNVWEWIYLTNESSSSRYFSEGNYELLEENVKVYYSPDNGYVIVSPDSMGMPTTDNADSVAEHNPAPWVGFLFLIAVVLIINILLTRFITKSIMNPLKTLTTGVHEIRDGNLDYRIDYNKKDEFRSVCEDFNEMGVKLSDMVEQRQSDERSRKELIAGISHDLRTPLTSIKAYLEGLEKGVAATPEMQEKYLVTIKDKTENLEYIINQLFIFSKLDIGEFPLELERADIVSELKDIVADVICEHKSDSLSLSYSGQEEELYCMIDAIQFQNVIQNVVSNSHKYNDKDETTIVVDCVTDGENAVITLTDNGPGVAEEDLDKIFTIFYREDESRQKSHEGSGIGLSISQKIIEQFGGSITGRNGDGGGLQVIISLPLSKEDDSV